MAYAALGETRRAIELLELRLLNARELGDRRGEGNVLSNLGNAYRNLGEPQRAIQFYEQSLVIARELGDRRGEGMALSNLGTVYSAVDETERAKQFYEQALVIHRALGDRRGEGIALGNLGNVYAILGKTKRPLQFHEQYPIAREIGDRRGEGNALWNMSLAFAQLGNRTQAIRSAEQALTIYDQIEDPRAAKVRAQLSAWHEETNSVATEDPTEIKAAIERLVTDKASDADRNVLRAALTNGLVVTGERAVALGGNASDVIITTGDYKLVVNKSSRRAWIIPGLVAAILFVGGVASNLIASVLQTSLQPYRPWVWLIFVIALIVAVATSLVESRRNTVKSRIVNALREHTIVIGDNFANSTIVTGDKNVFYSRTDIDRVEDIMTLTTHKNVVKSKIDGNTVFHDE